MSFLEVGQALTENLSMHIMFALPQSKDASVMYPTQATRAEKAKLLTYRFLFFKMAESQELK